MRIRVVGLRFRAVLRRARLNGLVGLRVQVGGFRTRTLLVPLIGDIWSLIAGTYRP